MADFPNSVTNSPDSVTPIPALEDTQSLSPNVEPKGPSLVETSIESQDEAKKKRFLGKLFAGKSDKKKSKQKDSFAPQSVAPQTESTSTLPKIKIPTPAKPQMTSPLQLSSGFSGIRAPRLPVPQLLEARSVNTQDLGTFIFTALAFTDLGLQAARDVGETTNGTPVIENPGINFNFMRPDRQTYPIGAGVSSFAELANGYTTVTRRAIEDLTPNAPPRVFAQDYETYNTLLINELTTPFHDYSVTTRAAVANPYGTDRNNAGDWFANFAYSGMFFGRSVLIPTEMQQLRNQLNAGQGCTDEQNQLFNDIGDFSQYDSCDDFQADNPNAVGWLTNSNDPASDDPDLSLPKLSVLGTTTWAVRRFGGAYKIGEQLNANLGFFQTMEGNDNEFGVGSVLGGIAIPTTQIILASQAGTPLDPEGIGWSLASTVVGLGEAATTDDPKIARAYANQNLIIGLGYYLPGNMANLYDANASKQSTMAQTVVTVHVLGGAGMYGLGGFSLGRGMKKGTESERVGLSLVASAGQGINTYNTIKYATEGEPRVWIPWGLATGSFIGSTAFSFMYPDSKITKFFANNVEAGFTPDGGPMVGFSGEFGRVKLPSIFTKQD